MRTWWMLLVLAACPAPAPAPAPSIDLAATAMATLDRDAPAMLELIRAAYAEAGVTVATNLTLDLQARDALQTSYDDTLIRIAIPTPTTSPDEAHAYWKAWGTLTRAPVDELFTDEVQRIQLARFAVFVALARQVGHFLQASYVGLGEPAVEALVADRLAIALLGRLARRPELAELVERYRALLTRWQAALPEGARVELPADLERHAAEHPLPLEPGELAALSIARQLRLLAKPPALAEVVTRSLLDPHQAQLRKITYGSEKLVVTSGRDVPGQLGFTGGNIRELATTLVDPDGGLVTIACSGGTCEIAGETGEPRKLVLANVLGELAGFERVLDVTVAGGKLWLLLGTGEEAARAALAIVDLARPDGGKPAATWPDVEAARLAASPTGAVSVMLRRKDTWRVERFEPGATTRASWTFRLGASGDADGANGAAAAALGDCTSTEAGTLYCAAGFRIRGLDKERMWTLAGGNRDWVDATDARRVAFTSPRRLRATRSGLVLVDRKYSDDGRATWKLRQVELKGAPPPTRPK